MNPPSRKIVHLHIPKTAGTALRIGLQKAYGSALRVFPHYDERKYVDAVIDDYDLFSGHFGFEIASRIGGDILTVLRHPVDRFISVYYFWRELYEKGVERSRNTILATKYPLDQFVLIRDAPSLIEEFYNRMTWQLAFSSLLEKRQEWRAQGKTDDDLLRAASGNLGAFALVGIQERMAPFVTAVADRYAIALKVERENTTVSRVSVEDVGVRTLRAIQEWTYIDLELYRYVCDHFRDEAQPRAV